MKLTEHRRWKIDTIRNSGILITAEELAGITGRALETVEGRQGVRIEDGASLRFTPSRTDLSAYDQVVAVYRTGGEPVRPSLEIELTTRTEGLTSPDGFRSGPGAVTQFDSDWGEYPFPWENFLVFGMGELVNPVRWISLCFADATAAAPVLLVELRVERRDRAPGPRLTDEGLQEVLNGFDGRGLLEHLRHRERPLNIYGQETARASADTISTADGICRNVINGYFLGDPVHWHINPNGYLEWMHALNRHAWIKTLLAAYQTTREVRYVQKLEQLWQSWLRDNPEPIGHNGGGDPAWETLSTAARVCGPWLEVFFALLNDPNFSDSVRIEILKSFYGHAEHLMDHQGYANNWLIVESRVLFVLGLLFPEFKRSGAWLNEGASRLAKELEQQIWPDGANWEISPGYHMMACKGFLQPLELARLNGLPLPSIFEERLPATFDYIAGMTRPDGTLPSVNDSGGWCGKHGAPAYLEYGAGLFCRPEWQQSPEGAYAGRSRVFPDAGFQILAEGTGHEAMWSLLDGGSPGASHCHEDALNVEFFAFGLPFIVDPGITGYMQDDWTRYYRTSQAHNTVLVNGATQAWAAQPRGERAISMRGQGHSALGDIADVARSTYNRPYARQSPGLSHTRALLFVRGGYWVVFDDVRGDAAQTLEARFQFVPLRLTLDRRKRVFRTLRQSLPNLELRPVAVTGRMSLTMATGATAPVGGWVSNGEDVPAPQARIALKKGAADQGLRLITVVYPYALGVASGLRFRLRPADADPMHSTLELRRPDGSRDTIRYAWDDRSWTEKRASNPPLTVCVNGVNRELTERGWNEGGEL